MTFCDLKDNTLYLIRIFSCNERVMDKLQSMAMLIKVVEAGSFSGASKILNVPLPTLSRKISELEDHLGIRLLHRTTRQLSLTSAGVNYMTGCKRVIEQVEEIELEVKEEYSEPKGNLVITAPVMFGRRYVLPIVTEFLSLHSNINVQLELSDKNINLYDNEVDMAVRIGALPDSSMIATLVGTLRLVTCASAKILNKKVKILSPNDLVNLPFVSLKIASTRQQWSYSLPESEISFNVNIFPRLTITDSESVVKAAINGVGATQQLHYQVKDAIENGELKVLLPEFEPANIPVNLVHKSRKYMPQKMRTFLDFAEPKLKNKLDELNDVATLLA